MINEYLDTIKKQLETELKIKTTIHNGNFSEQDLNRIINVTPQIIISPVTIKSSKMLDSVTLKKDLNISVFVVLRNYEFDEMLETLQQAELQLLNLKAKNASPITKTEIENLYSSSLDRTAINMWAISFDVEIYQEFSELDHLEYKKNGFFF